MRLNKSNYHADANVKKTNNQTQMSRCGPLMPIANMSAKEAVSNIDDLFVIFLDPTGVVLSAQQRQNAQRHQGKHSLMTHQYYYHVR